jgi:hypothetical protein
MTSGFVILDIMTLAAQLLPFGRLPVAAPRTPEISLASTLHIGVNREPIFPPDSSGGELVVLMAMMHFPEVYVELERGVEPLGACVVADRATSPDI